MTGWGQGGGKGIVMMVWWLIFLMNGLTAVFVRILDDF